MEEHYEGSHNVNFDKNVDLIVIVDNLHIAQ